MVSVASSVVTWRASVAAAEGAARDEAVRQDLSSYHHRLATIDAWIDVDQRLLPRYQEHARSRSLARDARDAVRAREDLALMRVLLPYFQAADMGLGDERGNVAYDREYVRRYHLTSDAELRRLRSPILPEAANEAHRKTTRLVSIAALLVVALFFLTLARFSRRQLGWLFLTGGVLASGAGVVLFGLVELRT